MTETDGTALLASFERLATAASTPGAAAHQVFEAAALGVALAELGLLDRAPARDRVASLTRRALLTVASLREAATDEDAIDALDLAVAQARRGAALLSGGPLSALDGARALEPTPHELASLLRGQLDGHAAADVALRLHRSGARDRYAAFLPSGLAETRVRLAADSAPIVRDPSGGRPLGTQKLGAASLEAHAFEGEIVAIYAEPAIALSLVSTDAPLATRAIEAAGYLELAFESSPAAVTLVLADGERSLTWTLPLAQIPAR